MQNLSLVRDIGFYNPRFFLFPQFAFYFNRPVFRIVVVNDYIRAGFRERLLYHSEPARGARNQCGFAC